MRDKRRCPAKTRTVVSTLCGSTNHLGSCNGELALIEKGFGEMDLIGRNMQRPEVAGHSEDHSLPLSISGIAQQAHLVPTSSVQGAEPRGLNFVVNSLEHAMSVGMLKAGYINSISSCARTVAVFN